MIVDQLVNRTGGLVVPCPVNEESLMYIFAKGVAIEVVALDERGDFKTEASPPPDTLGALALARKEGRGVNEVKSS